MRPRQTPRAHSLGLLSRLVPLVVLVVGACWLMSTMQPVVAQSPQRNQIQQRNNGQFQNVQQNNQAFSNQFPGPQFTNNTTPTIPSAARLQPVVNPGNAPGNAAGNVAGTPGEVAESAPWEVPAFVTKVMSGGWLMLPLAICSLIVMALSLERMIALRRGRVIPRPFVRRFTECVEDGQLSYEEATELCKEFDCPVSEVFRAAVRRWGRPMMEVEQAGLM